MREMMVRPVPSWQSNHVGIQFHFILVEATTNLLQGENCRALKSDIVEELDVQIDKIVWPPGFSAHRTSYILEHMNSYSYDEYQNVFRFTLMQYPGSGIGQALWWERRLNALREMMLCFW